MLLPVHMIGAKFILMTILDSILGREEIFFF